MNMPAITEVQARLIGHLAILQPTSRRTLYHAMGHSAGSSPAMAVGYALDLLIGKGLVDRITEHSLCFQVNAAGLAALGAFDRGAGAVATAPTFARLHEAYVPNPGAYYRNDGNVHIRSSGGRC
jgi:hypothetical protein